ncbi:MAG: NADH dehydrogenase subunit I [Firmicutes bacterium ADurb.Bin193]|nr:MAG: NADH dehydrogenase subunit I [Firmicutes bacterium ADurb.Bin193]
MITINNKKDCTGCHACSNICPKSCISMDSDSEGFWYPVVDYNECIKCGLCIKVCPIINKKTVKNEPKAFACTNKDDAVRMESSSGGIFTLLAEEVIDSGGVVFGAGFDGDFNVIHSSADKKEELEKFRGSKYVQSKIGDEYKKAKEYLNKGVKVLFSGTPCQIGGLKSYLGREYDNLLCIDNICHGVPSPRIWRKYVDYREKIAGAKTKNINFRWKDAGWSGYSLAFYFENGKEYRETVGNDPYMKAYLKNICLRPSCYECEFKTLNRQSDLTLGDFWGVNSILPNFDDNKGTSLVFVNSKVGEAFFNKISDKMNKTEVDINRAVVYNSSAIKSSAYNPKRGKFFEDSEKLSFDKLVSKYCADSIIVKVKRILRKILKP